MTNDNGNSPYLSRRSLLGAAIAGMAAAGFGAIDPVMAQAAKAARQVPAVKRGTHTSFKPLKKIDAGVKYKILTLK